MNLSNSTYRYAIIAVCALLTFSCKKDDGPAGPAGSKSLINLKQLEPGVQCSAGGLLIQSGIDKNNNNILDSIEVDNSQYTCNGSNALSDKQILFKLGGVGTYDVNSNTWINLALPRFNINNYPGVDSIVLMAAPYGGQKTTIELYNITDSTIIANSAVTGSFGNNITAQYKFSNNCYSAFPKKEFDLGLKATAEIPGEQGYAIEVIMVLHRK